MRSRLIAGLKRYFHSKRMEGLLSVQVGAFVGLHVWCMRGGGTAGASAGAAATHPARSPHGPLLLIRRLDLQACLPVPLACPPSPLQGLRILEYACDHAAEHTGQALDMWALLEKEVNVGSRLTCVLSWRRPRQRAAVANTQIWL